MNYDMVKFNRGQIWKITFKKPENVGHEQSKNRPWIILSVDKFNKSSGMFTAACISTRDKAVTPSQVVFTNDCGLNNVIMCEQMRTFDYSSGMYLLEYMGTVSDEILEKVDVALSIHLGLHYSPITLNKLYDSMEAIIKSVGYMQSRVNTPKFTNEDVEKFATKLKELAYKEEPNIETIEEQKTPIVENEKVSEVSAQSKKEDVVVDIPKEQLPQKEEPQKKSKRNYIKWDEKTREEFLHDADTLPMKEVMKKWNISKKTRFYSLKNYVQGLSTTKKSQG